MKNIVYIILGLVCSQIILLADCTTNRYTHAVFDSITVQHDVPYGEAPVWYVPYNNTTLLLDIYEPFNDGLALRPLILWAHPGGFLLGDKTADDIIALCDSFARKGYVTASIGYRLGFDPLDGNSAERAVYRGTQDGRAAVRFMKQMWETYQIDTNRIFMGGSSAGGVMSLHVAYLDESERPESTFQGLIAPDLLCVDCSGNTYNHTVDLLGIVDMWGAMGDSSWRDQNDDTPVLIIHGSIDDVVPFDKGAPFGVFTMPEVHGALPIVNQSDSLNLPYTFVPFYGQNHEPHGVQNGYFNGQEPNAYWDTILYETNAFFYDLIRPNLYTIEGNSVVCLNDAIQTYSVAANEVNLTYCWTINGGEIVAENQNEITVAWNQTGQGSLNLMAYNEIDCRSNEQSVLVTVLPSPVADFFFLDFSEGTWQFVDNSVNAVTWLWDFGDGNVSEWQNPLHTYTENGSYTVSVTVTSFDGCTDVWYDQIDLLSLGLNDAYGYEEAQIKVFPNPATTVVYVQNDKNMVVKDLRLFNAYGQEVWQKQESGLTNYRMINVESLKSGLYYLQINAMNGQQSVQKLQINR